MSLPIAPCLLGSCGISNFFRLAICAFYLLVCGSFGQRVPPAFACFRWCLCHRSVWRASKSLITWLIFVGCVFMHCQQASCRASTETQAFSPPPRASGADFSQVSFISTRIVLEARLSICGGAFVPSLTSCSWRFVLTETILGRRPPL